LTRIGKERQIIAKCLGKITAKMVPRILADYQKQRRLHNSSFTHCRDFDTVITGDETWCFEYDPGTDARACSVKQNSPERSKSTQDSLAVQDHACVFPPHKRIVPYEFNAQG
jgi:hypothetical protein